MTSLVVKTVFRHTSIVAAHFANSVLFLKLEAMLRRGAW